MSAINPHWCWLLLSGVTPVLANVYTFDEALLLGSGYEKGLAQFNDQDAVTVWISG